MSNTRFSYVQIGARDPRALAEFYKKAVGFKDAEDNSFLMGKEGVCLTAPGFPEGGGPVFGFVPAATGDNSGINDCGFAHTCYETRDVKGAVRNFIKCGGSFWSTMKKPEIHPCVYCKDPEGNVVEFHIPFPATGAFSEKLVMAGSLLGLMPDKRLRRGDTSEAVRFIHVNIICPDWEKMCGFYDDVFGCSYFGKLKDHSGGYKEQVIGIKGVHVLGQHILLPGFHADYPTLEIFTYSVPGRPHPCCEEEIGINMIGFTCEDREKTAEDILAHGGTVNYAKDGMIMAGDLQNGRIMLR